MPSGLDGLQQLLLASREVEARHVESLAVGARLARRLPLVLAQHDDRNLRLTRRPCRCGDLVGRVADHVAALDVRDAGAAAELRRDAVAHGHDVLQQRARDVVAELVARVVGVRPDHDDRAQALAQRQQAAVVLQQHDAFASRPQGELAVGGGVHQRRRPLRVDERLLEQAQAQLLLQDAAHGTIDEGLGHGAGAHVGDEVAAGRRPRRRCPTSTPARSASGPASFMPEASPS